MCLEPLRSNKNKDPESVIWYIHAVCVSLGVSSRSAIGCHCDDSWLCFESVGEALNRCKLRSLYHAGNNLQFPLQ
jgi:hypothetical protein